MFSLDALLTEATKKGEASVHGAVLKIVDKNGQELYSKTAGYDSISADAAPVREDAVFRMASATKLIASVALLQCIDNGLIGLDDSLHSILPELDGPNMSQTLEADPDSESGFRFRPSTTKITPRHLLSHTSGLGYHFIQPLLVKWAGASRPLGGLSKGLVTDKYATPLLYDPGTGWSYGSSLDWAGIAVRRLHKVSFEKYLIENIWKPLGRSAPYPTFHLSQHPEYHARLMQGLQRTSDGDLEISDYSFSDNPDDEEGGGGLAATVDDYLAVMQDLISDEPRLLSLKTVSLMWQPQLADNATRTQMIESVPSIWDLVAGPARHEDINHGLGGALVVAEVPGIHQPKNVLVWGGAANLVWFMAKDQGVAGFFATQILPFGDSRVTEIVNAWKKEFWSDYFSK